MCSRQLASFVLFALNILLFIAGGVMLGIGIAAKTDPSSISRSLSQLPKSELDLVKLDELLANSANLLIAVGCFLFIFCFLGCFGGCCEIQWMLFIYWVALLLIIIFEIAIIIYAVVSPVKMQEHTMKLMEESFKKYQPETFYSNGTVKIPTDANSLYWFGSQTILNCCGVKSSEDYNDLKWEKEYEVGGEKFTAKVPPSCCLTKNTDNIYDGKNLKSCMTKTEQTYHQMGCYEATEKELKNSSKISIIVSVVIIVIELLCIVSAIYLWRQRKNVDQQV